jgi:ankyrin repeat protein
MQADDVDIIKMLIELIEEVKIEMLKIDANYQPIPVIKDVLMRAVSKGDVDMVKMLIEKLKTEDCKKDAKYQIIQVIEQELVKAAGHGYGAIVKILIEELKKDTDYQIIPKIITILTTPPAFGYSMDIIKLFIEEIWQDVSYNIAPIIDTVFYQALETAIAYGEIDKVAVAIEELIKNNPSLANTDQFIQQIQAALNYAVTLHNVSVANISAAKKLIEKFIKTKDDKVDGYNLWLNEIFNHSMESRFTGLLELVSALQKGVCEIKELNITNQELLLMSAVENRQIEVIKELIDNIGINNPKVKEALKAAEEKWFRDLDANNVIKSTSICGDIVAMFIENGCSADCLDPQGKLLLLRYALSAGKIPIVNMLIKEAIQQNADWLEANYSEITLTIAKTKGCTDIMAMLVGIKPASELIVEALINAISANCIDNAKMIVKTAGEDSGNWINSNIVKQAFNKTANDINYVDATAIFMENGCTIDQIDSKATKDKLLNNFIITGKAASIIEKIINTDPSLCNYRVIISSLSVGRIDIFKMVIKAMGQDSVDWDDIIKSIASASTMTENPKIDVFATLMENGYRLDILSPKDLGSLLMQAVKVGHGEIIKACIDALRYADAEKIQEALQLAKENKRNDLVLIFIENNCRLDRLDVASQESLLLYAINSRGHKRLLRCLLKIFTELA